jgi:hypothetical protein
VLAIANLDTKDHYDGALTMEDDEATTLTISVIANASVLAQFRPARREGGSDESYSAIEVLLTPQSQVIPNVSGVKFRSAEAGKPARVAALLLRTSDPQIGAGIPFTGQLSPTGGVTQGTGGVTTLGYKEFAGTVPITATSEATAQAVVTADAITFDGATSIEVEFSAPEVVTQGAGNTTVSAVLYEDGVSIGIIGRSVLAVNEASPWRCKSKRFTPTNGDHVYSIRFFAGATGASVIAGAGGVGALSPGSIKIMVAS